MLQAKVILTELGAPSIDLVVGHNFVVTRFGVDETFESGAVRKDGKPVANEPLATFADAPHYCRCFSDKAVEGLFHL